MSLTLEDSTTYQWLLKKGYTEGRSLAEAVCLALAEARGEVRGRVWTLLRQGTKKFGEPHDASVRRLAAVTNLDHLDRIADRIFDAVSWDDLLGTP